MTDDDLFKLRQYIEELRDCANGFRIEAEVALAKADFLRDEADRLVKFINGMILEGRDD